MMMHYDYDKIQDGTTELIEEMKRIMADAVAHELVTSTNGESAVNNMKFALLFNKTLELIELQTKKQCEVMDKLETFLENQERK